VHQRLVADMLDALSVAGSGKRKYTITEKDGEIKIERGGETNFSVPMGD